MHLEKKIINYMLYLAIGALIISGIFFIVMNFQNIYDNVSKTIFLVFDILLPLIWGMIIAFIIMPLVKNIEVLLEKMKMGKKRNKYGVSHSNRLIAMLLSFVIVIAVLGIFLVGIGFIIGGTIGGQIEAASFSDISASIQASIEQIQGMMSSIDNQLSELGIQANVASSMEGALNTIMASIQEFVGSLATGIGGFTSGFIKFIFGFIFAANIIINREYFGRMFENFLRLTLKPARKTSLQGLIVEINGVLGSFVRGQLVDLTLNSIVTGIALMVAGFNTALFLGFFAGFTNIIPYLGSVIGATPVLIVGIAQGGLLRGLFGFVFVLIVQQLYITFVTPRIQGDRIGVHPMFVLLSVTVFGSLFGIVGMILATPTAGIISILVKRWASWRVGKTGVELLDLSEEEK